jgi:hypothetical protein
MNGTNRNTALLFLIALYALNFVGRRRHCAASTKFQPWLERGGR